jgi:DNA invertase Pin-like site-specific DNA recombinase
MDIKSGLVPRWMADLLNGRRDDTAVERRGEGITESGSADDGRDLPAVVSPVPAATAPIIASVSTRQEDQSVQMSSSPGGDRSLSPGRDPWTVPAPPRTVTAALYVPAGTPDENQSKQMSELRRYALRKGWEVLEFRERHARAGTRPVFNEMMRRTPRFSTVLIGSLDCFGRTLADLHASLSRLRRKGIRFIALHDEVDVDPKTGAGASFFNDLTLLVRVERNMHAGNVRTGIARARSLGKPCGRPPRRFSRTEACQLRQEGLSLSVIAARLGVPASTVADAVKGQKQPPS